MVERQSPPHSPFRELPRAVPPIDQDWLPTGRYELRRRWWGARQIAIEEQRREWRPVVLGYSPMNWRVVSRWRWVF